MRSSEKPQSTTSLPRAPHDDESVRVRKYMITMGIRIACIVLMLAITPYGWYTWIFAVGAVFLPYIAVVIANVGQDSYVPAAVQPELALPEHASAPQEQEPENVVQIAESAPPPPVAPPVEGDLT